MRAVFATHAVDAAIHSINHHTSQKLRRDFSRFRINNFSFFTLSLLLRCDRTYFLHFHCFSNVDEYTYAIIIASLVRCEPCAVCRANGKKAERRRKKKNINANKEAKFIFLLHDRHSFYARSGVWPSITRSHLPPRTIERMRNCVLVCVCVHSKIMTLICFVAAYFNHGAHYLGIGKF